MTGIYPRTIAVHRMKTVAGVTDAIGLVGYSGAEQGSGPQGEDVLFTGIPASIQKGPAGRKKDGALPTDAVWAPTWRIFIPLASMDKGNIRDRDIIVDDELYRYQVGQAYWNILGYQLICIRLEA
jgi:hypothetical protein